MKSKPDLIALPRHIAMIMDGNGRWAAKKMLPRTAGHRAGVKTLKRMAEAVFELGIPYLTVYAFSTENAARPEAEVRGLLSLIRRYFDKELPSFIKDGIRVRVIGDRAFFSDDIRQSIASAEKQTAGFCDRTFTVALNYGARAEIVRAVNRAVARLGEWGEELGIRNEELGTTDILGGPQKSLKDESTKAYMTIDPQKPPAVPHSSFLIPHTASSAAPFSALYAHPTITEEEFAALLDTVDLPDPDMIIRTGGESRLSNFLLYQAAYAELFFVTDLWPDFNKKRLREVLEDYGKRSRRFGK